MKINNWREGSIVLSFDNGLEMSIIWGPGSYTSNHDADFSREPFEKPVVSGDVEIMFRGDWPANAVSRILERDFPSDDGVAGYIPVEKIFELAAIAQMYIPGRVML